MKKQTIIKGTLILTAAGLISRILGFINRIYLSNLIGAEGIGLYQLVFPIYMICYTVCCSGLFTAISRLAAEENTKNNPSNVRKMLRVATTISTLLAVALMFIIYFNAEFISTYVIKEPRITLGLKIISISIPFTAITHSIKGYFYGTNRPTLPAISQVTEQIVRISIIYVLSSYFVTQGLSYACAVAVIGMAIGEISSCILVYIFYHHESKNARIQKATNKYRYYYRKVTNIAFPLTANRLITTFLASYETILIPSKLVKHGYSHNFAISIYGTLTGMALPLIFFPTVVTTSASLVLLPAVSEAHSKKQKSVISNTVSKTIKLSLLIGIVFAFFFFSFGNDLGIIIYNEAYVGELLLVLSFLCPFLYLQTTLGSLLNGLDLHLITFRNNIIGLGIRIAFIYTLIPVMGLQGYLIGLIVSLVVVSFLDIFHLVRATRIHFNALNFIITPSICCFGTLSAIEFLKRFYTLSFGLRINTIIQSAVYFIILIPLLLLTKCICIKDFKS